MIANTYDGNDINDATNYVTVIDAGAFGQTIAAARLARLGKWPVAGANSRTGGKFIPLTIYIKSGTFAELASWFDPDDEASKVFVGTDTDGSTNPRSLDVRCISFFEVPDLAGQVVDVVLQVDGDIRLTETAEQSDTWNITASGQTNVINNTGDADVYPVYKIKPTANKTGGYGLKRWVPVRWKLNVAYTNYPYDLTDGGWDTATIVTATKMQADGDDLRVEVNGVEVDRWLADMNGANTKVWANLTFAAKQEITLKTAIASSGSISTIDSNESISGFPTAGLLNIASETFSYTGTDTSAKQFTGVTRAAKGTSMAAHSVDDTAWWVQNSVFILYDNSSASAPSVDDDYKAIFNLSTSTNDSWVYADFGEDATGPRPASWVFLDLSGDDGGAWATTGNRGGSASPWVELGMYVQAGGVGGPNKGAGRFSINNPCGITNANFTNGEIYATDKNRETVIKIQSSANGSTWASEYTIPDPSANATWENWSRNEALDSGSVYAALFVDMDPGYPDTDYWYLEAADCTITLNSSNTPDLVFGAEQGNYNLAVTFENVTTGLNMVVTFSVKLDETLEIDTESKTVTLTDDGSLHLEVLAWGVRRDWLIMQPGNNTFKFTDSGTQAVTVTTTWKRRYYD